MLKPVAEGVASDIGKLLNEFVKANSFEFSVFASIWRKHHFSQIYFGRSDVKELVEFTNEAFRAASRFLISATDLYQVGGLFLIYGLFRNQPANPPVRARLQLCHWKNVLKLRDLAEQEKCRSLHYVIDYMTENGFDFVACQTLMGPRISSIKNAAKLPPEIIQLSATLKSGLTEIKETQILEELQKTHADYIGFRNGVASLSNMTDRHEDRYDYFLSGIDKLLGSAGPSRGQDGSASSDIGLRRTQLKAAAFSRKSDYRRGNVSDSEGDAFTEDLPEEKPVIRKRYVRQREKRIGRPRKKPLVIEVKEESEESEEEKMDHIEILKQQSAKYFAINNGPKPGKRLRRPLTKRFYYETTVMKNSSDEEQQ